MSACGDQNVTFTSFKLATITFRAAILRQTLASQPEGDGRITCTPAVSGSFAMSLDYPTSLKIQNKCMMASGGVGGRGEWVGVGGMGKLRHCREHPYTLHPEGQAHQQQQASHFTSAQP